MFPGPKYSNKRDSCCSLPPFSRTFHRSVTRIEATKASPLLRLLAVRRQRTCRRETYWSACHATPAPSASGSRGAGSLLHGLLLHGLLIGLHSSLDTYRSACHATPAPSASASCGAGFLLHGLLISR